MGNSESQSLDPSASYQLEQYANVPKSLSQSLSGTSESSNDGSGKPLPLPITTNKSLSNNSLPDIIVSPSSLTKNSSKLFDANGNNYAEQQTKRVSSTSSNQQRPTTLPLQQCPLSPSDIMEDVNLMLRNMALLTTNTGNPTEENITENDDNIDDDVRPYSEDIFAGLHALLRDILAPLPPGAPNRMHDPYNSVADYQRVMLPLIRYDYFAALHQGIRNLADQLSAQEFTADNTVPPQLVSNAWYWVYNNKRIVLRTQHKIRFVVQLSLEERPKNFNKMQAESTTMTTTTLAKNPFSDKKYQDVDGEEEDDDDSKIPFMNGSLLLFTSSLELNDLVLATCVKVDGNGLVEIHIVRTFNIANFLNQPLIMLEAKSFFDPLHHIYRRLCSLDERTFPLREQLLHCIDDNHPPAYQTAPGARSTYYKRPGNHALQLRDPNAIWPTAEQLGYNDSQLVAIRHALTHRVAMIQGPPGTGKSFVGLELVNLLLHNTSECIILVCNTNQALDQFLVALLEQLSSKFSDAIVRMGYQCVESALQHILMGDLGDAKHNWIPGLLDAYRTIDKCNIAVSRALAEQKWANMAECETLLNGLLDETSAARQHLSDLFQRRKWELVKGKRLIGMTSSFAAKNGTLCGLLKAQCVIVEEASEMLEVHIIAALTEHTQHLIQIGDHKQLRPRTCSVSSAQEFHLDVSLLERLHKNGLPAVALNLQHRMHPLLADLIRPNIYAQLTDAPNVQHFPEMVHGMPGRLLFVDHRHVERARGPSRINFVEAQMVQRLCAYLLEQGHRPDDITVLCAYRAQIAQLEMPRRSGQCYGCAIAVVDGFQGRESRIVLLSLVRNNATGCVGFMSAANRACVALSRAREALYMFGNIEMLAKRSDTWKHVRQQLETATTSTAVAGKLEGCFGGKIGNTNSKIIKARDLDRLFDGRGTIHW